MKSQKVTYFQRFRLFLKLNWIQKQHATHKFSNLYDALNSEFMQDLN